MRRYIPVGAVLIALGLLLGACDSGTATTTTTTPSAPTTSAAVVAIESGITPVIVDYSPTVSDVGGLMYLLSHPDVEVVAISLPGTGEAGCELGVEVTLGILAMYDREDIPVACDPDIPDGAKDWPEEFLAGHENLSFGLPESTATASELAAPDLIAKAAADAGGPVVLYAVAPLTNVARALDRHPDLAGELERIVIMGGAVDALGNVFDSDAEWNIWIDVPSAADVVASGVPVTLVPLDATNHVPVPDFYEALLEEAEQSDAIVYLHTMVRTFPQVSSGFWYFWDELAATVAAGASRTPTEPMSIVVVEGGSDDGRTVRDETGYPASVMMTVVQPNAFYTDFIETLSGSALTPPRAASPEEVAYLEAIEAATSHIPAALEETFADPVFIAAFDTEPSVYDPEGVAALFERFFSAFVTTYDAVVVLDPPTSLQAEHDNFLEILGVFPEHRDDVVVAAAQAVSVDELFATTPQFPDINDACRPMAEAAFLLGVDVVIACNPRQ